MVVIEGGTFVMGDVYEQKNPDSTPVHKVTLPDFRIGKYEVTYKEYDAFARRTGRELPEADSMGRGNRAVAFVDWYDAKAFCEFHGWRLPTEQEWEYAARSGGKETKFAGTNNIDSLDMYARTSHNNHLPYSFPVGSKKPNEAGLYDMSGNLIEWIGGYYQFYPEKGEDPKWAKLEKGGIRILRGGSFKEGRNIASTHWRVGMLTDAKQYDVGFRCVDPME
jgi:formylglycine-generating enzyme required for sulfatase activity